jgi:hypothetical protein
MDASEDPRRLGLQVIAAARTRLFFCVHFVTQSRRVGVVIIEG